MIKVIVASFILLASASLLSFNYRVESVQSDDDRNATPEEVAKIQQVLATQGCSLVDDVDFQLTSNLYEVDDVICQDGKSYEMYLDQNFKVVFQRQDD